jgi:UDP-N-acetylmuramoyl-tripeptide--D-alanyl-D-alanine ligase
VTALSWVAGVAAAAALGIALLKWLRVAQREHYIVGSCWRTGWRWARRRPPNLVLGLAVALAILAAIGFRIAADRPAAVAVSVLVAAAANVAFPWPMPLRGDPPLRLTRRATVLAGVALALTAIVAVGVGLAWSWLVGLALASGLAFLAVDLAMAVTAPFERRALQRHRARAEARLRQVDPVVVAITGSWGKTSTKNHVRDLLTGWTEVVASPASWNNTAGLSRTVNEHLTDTTEVLVAEMGTYGRGEIREMCAWVRPRVGVICAIGPMHLERMGSIDTIVAAKSEILDGVDIAVLWVDDPRLDEVARRAPSPQVVRVGTRGGADLDVEVARQDDQLAVWVGGDLLGHLPAEGAPHPGNLGCAVAAALAAGASATHVAARLGSLGTVSHRAAMGTSDSGLVVIDDTFNSNPAGARAAVERLAELVGGRRAVVTPGMVELGPVQDEENESLARAIVESGATLVAVGWTNRRALRRGGGAGAVYVADRDEARAWVRANLAAGDGVLWENDLPDHYP